MDLLREKLRCGGLHRLRCADAPDMSGINAAAKQDAQLGQDELNFYKQAYADSAPQRAAATELATQQANLQNQLSQQELQTQQEQQQRYNTTFAPIEDKIASDAMAYDTPARREAAAAAASADVQANSDAQTQATMRDLERTGAAPNSGRVAAMRGMMDVGTAAAKAGAANSARQQVETIGSAKMMDAAGLGRGVVSNQATSAGIALKAGDSAVGNGQVPVNVAGAGAAMMGQGYGGAIGATTASGNLYGTAANLQNQANQSNDAIWGALGSAAGMWAGGGFKMPVSDENAKEDVHPVNDEEALKAVEKVPVKNWKYKPGVEDGGRHIGPMAQKVAAAMGMDAAPGGKKLDLVTLNGMNMAAIRGLAKKVDRIAAAAGIPA